MTEKTIRKAKYVDNGDGTVSDLTNNLMWFKKDTWIELGRQVSWHESQAYAKEVNDKKFAGYSNWRVPTGSEVKFLFDGEASNTDVEGGEIHLNSVFSPGCGFSTWTSETRGAKAAMGYDLRSSFEFWLAKENDGFPSAVRLVRQLKSQSADEDGEPRFTNNGDGTVSDKETQLMWKADDSFLELDKWVSWEEAKTYIEGLNRVRFAGNTDWRMPTRKEVQTIFDPGNPVTDKYGDTILLAPEFPPGAGQTCWTKTLNKTDKSLVIRFQFYNGDYKWHQLGLRSHGVRAVRDNKK
ncbi:MAG TPA: DUF1566 domain-containing protein [Nitrospinaceae bacterium]|jgi:hypothetical protein|nr:DUF1566 domain-containing protein [Nitrospinaceae bacterium]HJL72509.1 DUF1566 domain-containing protein [Nitrospinaceae bacterium]HJN99645.1 DUF1566 domain-containing protein [Nitrospinaceae bacterium]|tara:strand:- start:2762 stop:3646 length:885 start_codon:yes stop_codon:yes gene_type:complete